MAIYFSYHLDVLERLIKITARALPHVGENVSFHRQVPPKHIFRVERKAQFEESILSAFQGLRGVCVTSNECVVQILSGCGRYLET